MVHREGLARALAAFALLLAGVVVYVGARTDAESMGLGRVMLVGYTLLGVLVGWVSAGFALALGKGPVARTMAALAIAATLVGLVLVAN